MIAENVNGVERLLMSREVFLETTKLGNLNSGLGQFCLQLGSAICKQNELFHLTCLLPPNGKALFGEGPRYINSSKWKRLFGLSLHSDIWHCFYQGSPYWPRQKKTKVVLTIHDLNFVIKYSGWKRILEMNRLQRQVNRADRIVAISNYTRQEIIHHLQVDESKITVIHNGVRLPAAGERKPTFIDNRKFFFSLGIISPKKNFHVLLPLIKQSPDHVLVIAGNNDSLYAKQLKNQVQSMGLSDRVILPGEIMDDEKNWLYRNCEAFLFPSVAEGFGLPVIEAMTFGRPVLLSTYTSLPEVGGPHAYYFNSFEPESMVETLRLSLKDYRDNPDKQAMIKQWASQFSWEAAAQKYLTIYQSLLDECK